MRGSRGSPRSSRRAGYPEAGRDAGLALDPRRARDACSEQVLEHRPRRLHRIRFSDPESSGELESRFEVEGEGTRVTLTLTYRVGRGGPLAALTERVFIRGQVRGSLRRTLLRFKHEAEEVAHFATAPPPPDQ